MFRSVCSVAKVYNMLRMQARRLAKPQANQEGKGALSIAQTTGAHVAEHALVRAASQAAHLARGGHG